MRLRHLVVVLTSVIALVTMSACGDDDPPDAVESASSPTGSDDAEPGHPLSAADLRAAVQAGQLDVADLGEGWILASTEPPNDDEEDTPLDRCMPDVLDERLDASKVAESETRLFRRSGDDPVPTEMRVASVGFDDRELLGELHRLLRSSEFGACFATALQQLLAASVDEIEVGELVVEEDVVDPGDDPDLASTMLTLPMSLSADGQLAEITMRLTLLSSGQLGATLLQSGPEELLDAEAHAEWGRLLAERLTGG